MAVPEIIEKLDVCTETGTLIAELLNISTSTKLAAIRNILLGEKTKERIVLNFVFLRKHAPVSNKQEESITLSRIVENGKDTKFLYLRPTDPVSSFTVPIQSDKKKPTCNDEPALLYSAEEIQFSEGIEREKRTCWNKRIQDFAQDLHEKRRTKHKVNGIIDLEWMQKKSDLLKVPIS